MFNLCKRLLHRKIVFGSTVGVALFFMLIGVVCWGAFNTALEVTNDMNFCISCHEMEENVYTEYINTIHYNNRSGVRATCPDCHVPKEWQHMLLRKIFASRELFQKIIGTIDTPEKFNLKRLELAQHVWQSMEQTNSRECRNCHNFNAMDIAFQESRSGLVHTYAQQRNKTCIDCHKGIAHQLPDGVLPYKGGSDDDHQHYEQQQIDCYQCHEGMPKPNTDDWEL
ncbi:NapC/NirT family cytochrome c [Photobacterium profundum]|uniref:Cytochrome c-type protein n=1 Tax=Photobacterium profundum (strain SS9) TaxID=298386 RepID=Q6LJL4_PHOPR|nr:NapC/NirT family cytochrome c [Photobacterium profundum]CAG22516.1 putative cytochrome c-type protein [Photobacterium profundum SS9]